MMRPHHRANNRRIDELERDPLWEVTHADHTNKHPQPDPIDGHIPDYVAQGPFSQTLIGETEHCGDDSQHTLSQRDTFGDHTQANPGVGFEVNEFGCENDLTPDFDSGLPDIDPGFDDEKDTGGGGLLDFF